MQTTNTAYCLFLSITTGSILKILFSFLIPASIIVVLYITIFCKYRENCKRRESLIFPDTSKTSHIKMELRFLSFEDNFEVTKALIRGKDFFVEELGTKLRRSSSLPQITYVEKSIQNKILNPISFPIPNIDKETLRIIINISMILFTFCLCWIPYYSLISYSLMSDTSIPGRSIYVTFIFVFLYCSISPIIYACRLKQLRQHFKVSFA